jgi:hypothetical protein
VVQVGCFPRGDNLAYMPAHQNNILQGMLSGYLNIIRFQKLIIFYNCSFNILFFDCYFDFKEIILMIFMKFMKFCVRAWALVVHGQWKSGKVSR